MKTTFTYGKLPDREDFNEAFREKCPDGRYEFGNDARVGNATLNADGVWNQLLAAHQMFEDDVTVSCEQAEDAGAWCSAVLETLGFEWI